MAIIPWNIPDVGEFFPDKHSPRINVYETKIAILIEIGDFKGNPESFEVFIRSGTLFIRNELFDRDGKATRKPRNKNKGEIIFEKVVKLPVGIDVEASRAITENDVIRITIPKVKGKTVRDKQLEIETPS